MTILSNSGSSTSCQDVQEVGAKPAYIKWNIVRGDTASILVQFLQNDETTFYDTAGWTYESKAYNAKTDVSYLLTTEVVGDSVKITAPLEMTALWGTLPNGKVLELSFDLQVDVDVDTVWTPIIGVINVIGDVPGDNS